MPTPAGGGGLRVYATEQEYADWLGLDDPPDGAATALIRASRIVDQILLTSIYDVDEDGYATDTAAALAIQEATCAQAEYAAGAGDANLVGAGAISQVALGSLSYTRARAGTGVDGNPRWSQTAWELLQQAGLTGHGVQGG